MAARSAQPGVIDADYGSESPQFTMRTPCPGWIAIRIKHACLGVHLIAAVQGDEMFRAGREAECDRIGKDASGSGESIRSEALHRVRLPGRGPATAIRPHIQLLEGKCCIGILATSRWPARPIPVII